MEESKEAGLCYDFLNDRYLAAMGDCPDITAAFYDGDWTKNYEKAQSDKHDWILKGIDFESRHRVLDIGCGWGPMLRKIKNEGGYETGLTVSKRQFDYCREKGLNAYLQDWKETDSRQFGIFDEVISVGAFEHFCSGQEYLDGKQDEIYKNFFKFCSNVLKDNGKIFLQTMIWGYKVPEPDKDFDLNAQKGSDERIRAKILSLSSWWPPKSKEQVVRAAEPHFELIESNNGREDYIKTFREVYLSYEKTWRGNFLSGVGDYLRCLVDSDFKRYFRHFGEVVREKLFREAFISHVLDHERMFFRKK